MSILLRKLPKKLKVPGKKFIDPRLVFPPRQKKNLQPAVPGNFKISCRGLVQNPWHPQHPRQSFTLRL